MTEFMYVCRHSEGESRYFIEAATEQEAYDIAEKRLWEEWEGTRIVPMETSLEEIPAPDERGVSVMPEPDWKIVGRW